MQSADADAGAAAAAEAIGDAIAKGGASEARARILLAEHLWPHTFLELLNDEGVTLAKLATAKQRADYQAAQGGFIKSRQAFFVAAARQGWLPLRTPDELRRERLPEHVQESISIGDERNAARDAEERQDGAFVASLPADEFERLCDEVLHDPANEMLTAALVKLRPKALTSPLWIGLLCARIRVVRGGELPEPLAPMFGLSGGAE